MREVILVPLKMFPPPFFISQLNFLIHGVLDKVLTNRKY